MTRIDAQATALTRARYQRLSAIYDFMEGMAEFRYRPWREKLWAQVKGLATSAGLVRRLSTAEGLRVLEVGVGTGKNMPYWPKDVPMTAIDLTPGMLAAAERRAQRLGLAADLRLGDVQALDFPDGGFDAALATFVFCSVPDPVLGLRELKRVVKPGGQLLLLEHVRSAHPRLGALMDFVNPLVVRLMGANINRRTVENVRAAGWRIERVEDLGMGASSNLSRPGQGVEIQAGQTAGEHAKWRIEKSGRLSKISSVGLSAE